MTKGAAMGRKVLFTASTYSHIVNFHLPYLRRFQEEGWTVHVACGGQPMPIPYADLTLDLPFEKSMSSPKNFKAAAVLRGKIREEGYDLISTHTSLAAFFTRLALLGLKGRPLVANMVHGYLFDDQTPWHKRSLLLAAERSTASVTDLLLTMNRWDYDAASAYALGRKVVHIPGVGVDLSRLYMPDPELRRRVREGAGVAEEAFMLFYAAEFSGRKSQSVLIRAMEQLPGEVVLVLAGDGTMRRECQELAGRLGVSDRVVFPGQVSDVGAWYAAADAAVSSSRIEGLPFNVMEAMSAGLPVVASSVKGHEDLIEDGETGLLYPYGDAGAFAKQILRLLSSQSLRRELGERGQKSAAGYRLEEVFPIVWAQYEALLPVRAAAEGR